MKFKYIEGPQPFMTIDEIYTIEELSGIFQELEFLRPNLLGPEKTGASTFVDDDKVRKNNSGVFLDSVYRRREFSNIIRSSRKFFIPNSVEQIMKCHPAYKGMKNVNHDTTLISYYEDDGYYLPHDDSAYITILTWLFKEPKNFYGGDLVFSDYNITVPVKNNAGVIFMSGYTHEVSKVKIIDSSIQGSGRYTITNFCNITI